MIAGVINRIGVSFKRLCVDPAALVPALACQDAAIEISDGSAPVRPQMRSLASLR